MERGNGFLERHKFLFFGVLAIFLVLFTQAKAVQAKIPTNLMTEFSENNILYYDPCDGGTGLSNTQFGGGPGSCAKLGELRTQMWNAASDEDKEDFMYIIGGDEGVTSYGEADNLAGIEGYMNQVIARSDGDLHKWLNGLCLAFRNEDPAHPTHLCKGSHKTTEKEQKWIDKALAGSNILNAATGNSSWSATGGDATTGGRVTCLWESDDDNENGGACKTDIDYTKEPFKSGTPKKGTSGHCSDMIKAAGGDIDSGWECWAWDNTGTWSKSMASQCGGYASVGTANAVDSAAAAGATTTAPSSSVTWDKKGWITGGFEGYTKEPSKTLIKDDRKYAHGKPNKILLHFTEGTGNGLAAYSKGEGVAAHFTTDLKKKETYQHVPLSIPSGALKGNSEIDVDELDVIQIEIVGYGFEKDNPDNPDENSKCIIDSSGDKTDSDYCFAKFGNEEWSYLAELLTAISKWGSDNGANIPLTTSVTWTGDVSKVRLSKEEWDNTSGIVGHMHAPKPNDHKDPGNIWPLVSAALGTTDCVLNSDDNSIKGAKNAEKQANEVGDMAWADSDKKKMKKLLEDYGDLAYRTGQAYDVPWIAILVQSRYESSDAGCGKNNFWGIKGPDKKCAKAANLGEGFTLYGKTVHNGYHDQALGITDPKEYLEKLGPTWVQGDVNGDGYGSINDMKKSVDALTKYIESAEGQQVIAAFGAANCNGTNGMAGGSGFCEGDSLAYAGAGNVGNSGDIVANVAYLIDLANKQGANYTRGGGGRSIESYKKFVYNGAPMANIDCTGFASLVYWYTYGDQFKSSDIFYSAGIIAGEFSKSYVEIDRSEVRPGDIFAYNPPPGQDSGHGGIVIEVNNGKVTKIAETGGHEGRSGNNTTLGYSGPDDFSVRTINSSMGHFFRWKGAS